MQKIKLLFILFALTTNALIAQKLSPGQLKEDFGIFRKSLEEVHPGLCRFTAKQRFDSAFNSTMSNISDSLTQQEFYQKLAPLVALIKCGHTKFFPESDVNLNQFHYFYDTTRLFPLKLFFAENNALVAGNYNGTPEPGFYGAEVLTINGEPINAIRDKLMAFIPADGNVVSSKYLELSKYFSAWYANFIGAPEFFHVDLRMIDGTKSSIELKPVSLTMINQEMKSEQNPGANNFNLDFPEDNIALMKIRNFYPLSPQDDYKNFLEQSFLQLKNKKTGHLIIDLRDNEGGIDRWGAMLYSYIAGQKFSYYKELRLSGVKYTTKPYLHTPRFFGLLKLFVRKRDGKYYWTKNKNLKVQKPNRNAYTGNVYVLINGNSYSVTAEFAAIAKSNQRALFFGQETGGTYEGNNSGTFAFVNLPNSGLTLAIPMLAYYLDVKNVNPPDRGILPDYYIPPALEGKDKELQFVMDFIKQP